MNKSQIDRLEVCRALARAIVQRYREDAPEGFDPQNSVAIVAVAGTAVAAGASAYEASQAGSAASGISAPKFIPAQFQSLDPNSLQYTDPSQANSLATQFDKQAYAASDADFAARHPGLAQANRTNESNVASAIAGNVPAALQNQLVSAGLSSAAGGFGNSIVPGSFGSAGIARNLGVGVYQYQQNAQNELAQLNAAAPERQIGLSGSGALQLQLASQATRNSVLEGNFQGQNQVNISNSTGQNASNQAGFAGALNAAAQSQAGQFAAINTGLSGLNSAANLYGKYGTALSNYNTNPNLVNPTMAGGGQLTFANVFGGT